MNLSRLHTHTDDQRLHNYIRLSETYTLNMHIYITLNTD